MKTTTATALLGAALNIILPARCPQTGEIVEHPGEIAASAWKDLTFITPPYCTCCGLPFEFAFPDQDKDTSNTLLCGACTATPKPYHSARAVLTYTDTSRNLILAFKHGDKTHLSVALGKLLYNGNKETLEKADAIIPVPLHWWRLITRRYNQAALLAHKCHELSTTPCWPDALQRIRNTPPQGHKNAKERHENVKGVFALNPRYATKIKGKKLVLIDDVHTTGATLEACAKVLLNAGAAQIDIITIARVTQSK